MRGRREEVVVLNVLVIGVRERTKSQPQVVQEEVNILVRFLMGVSNLIRILMEGSMVGRGKKEVCNILFLILPILCQGNRFCHRIYL